MEDHVTQMCSNLFDKNENKIDVNIVATVYLSAFEISAYLKKCTNYSSADIKLVAKYINDLPGYDSVISAMEQNKSDAMRQQAEEIAKAMKNI